MCEEKKTEEKILCFDLARKFSANNVNGLDLRSIKGTRAVCFNPKGYDAIRNLAREFKEFEGKKINVKGIGKSIELTCESIPELFLFLGKLNFVKEDYNEFVQFFNSCMPLEIENGKFEIEDIESDAKSAKIRCSFVYNDERDEEDVYGTFTEKLLYYSVGLVKRPQ